MSSIEYTIDKSSQIQVQNILKLCDKYFIPKLSTRVNIQKYSKKICDNAICFEAWHKENLIGLIAMYINHEQKCFGYITNVNVIDEYKNKCIASTLLINCIQYSKENKIYTIELEVNKNNISAINLYKKFGFIAVKEENDSKFMRLKLN